MESSNSLSRIPDAITDISRVRVGKLYPGIRPLAYRVLEDVRLMTGRKLNVVSGLREYEEQLILYAKGRERQPDGSWVLVNRGKVVTNARPGASWHNYGLAFDVAWAGQDPYLTKLPKAEQDELWAAYGKAVIAHGMVWGGESILIVNGVKDRPHAELSYGMTIAQAMELYNMGGLKAVWAQLDQHRGVPVGQDWGALLNG